jgi:hypothetical protein
MSSPQDERRWLDGHPSLDEMKRRHPDLWDETGRAFVAALEAHGPAGLAALANRSRERASSPTGVRGVRESRADLAAAIRHRMLRLAMEQTLAEAAAPASEGPRFHRWNGGILQKLLFRRDLERKPVSHFWFRLLWPFLPQKRLLMPLVQPRGIYCFYTRSLVRELARWIGKRRCLEIAAGDGTLTRFLKEEGVDVRATDNHAWTQAIRYPTEVEKLEARDALAKYRPAVVICSWPPPGNTFERAVFAAPGVESYVVLTTRHRFAAGDWKAYTEQTGFTRDEVPAWSRGLLPPEVDGLALRFIRRTTSPATAG